MKSARGVEATPEEAGKEALRKPAIGEAAPSSVSRGIDRALVRDLAELLKETDLTEIEVEAKGIRIRVSRISHPVPFQAYVPPALPSAIAPGTPPSGIGGAPRPAAEGGGPEAARHPGMVPSPMVGTAYLSPEPGAKPFVEVGASIREGQTILIIEAMKHMNEVAAPRSGRVGAILVTDGQPVEYGEPLIVIE